MPATIQPVISTPDLDRLHRFYADVFGADELMRVPPEGQRVAHAADPDGNAVNLTEPR